MSAWIVAVYSSSLEVGPTVINDEYRDKVARKLVAASGPLFDTFPDENYPDNDTSVLDTIRAAIGLPDNRSYGQLLYRLAELIGCPTCRAIEHETLDESNVCKNCSECQYGWFESIYDKSYSYCPNCGARIVRDDE